MTEFGLSQNHRRIISAIFSKYPDVEEVLVYESRAKGTFRPGAADIDMIITKKACLPQEILLKIVNDFDDSLLPFSVDLSVFGSLTNADLIAHIRRAGKCIYKKTESAEPPRA